MSYEVEFQKGAFLSLKHASLVSKTDIELYDQYGYNILKTQSTIMLFCTFWARMLDIGNVLPGFKTHKYGYYGFFISIPALIHAVYAGRIFNLQVEQMDRKYSQMFLEFKAKKQTDALQGKNIL